MHPDYPDSRRELFDTPRLARLSEQGMRFSDAYAPAPICTPTRRSIQFGMTPARQKGTAFVSQFDPTPHQSIPQMLKSINPDYQCGHFGKWGEVIVGDFRNPYSEFPGHPQILGYDRSDGITGNITGWFYHWKYDPENEPRNIQCEAWDDPKLTFSVAEKAVDFIRRQAEARRPFYLQVSFYAVHTALQARRETIEKYRARGEPPPGTYFGIGPMMDDMDQAIGSILDALDRHGLADHTYVIFSSDNGGSPKGHGVDGVASPQISRNKPLRKGKGSLSEGGIRVPMIVRGPGIAPGSFCRTPVALYDLWPTLRELAGDPSPAPTTVDGGSLADLFRRGDEGVVRRNDPFLIFSSPRNGKGEAAIREGDYKLLVQWTGDGRAYLFDLAEDISESRDLFAAMPDKARELFDRMIAYFDQVDAEGPRTIKQFE